MSESKHTKGLLVRGRRGTTLLAGERIVCDCGGRHFSTAEHHDAIAEEDCANADRLAACWNACAGINPEAVPMMLDALEFGIDIANNGSIDDIGSLFDRVKAAVKKARG